MKKWFKDNTLECQKLTPESAKKIFGIPDNEVTNSIEREQFIVVHNYEDSNYSVQICFNILNSYDNNGYLVLVFNRDDELIIIDSVESFTPYPPVWNREFGYIDYTDFLKIQKKINETLTKMNIYTMEYDLSLEKRSHYFTQENPITEIPKLLKEGKSYSIIDVFAWKKPELAELSKKLIGL